MNALRHPIRALRGRYGLDTFDAVTVVGIWAGLAILAVALTVHDGRPDVFGLLFFFGAGWFVLHSYATRAAGERRAPPPGRCPTCGREDRL